MAIKKSNFTGGNGRLQLHSPYVAKVPAVAIIEHTFTEAVGAADILELAYLPPYCRILEAELLTVGTAAVTFDVGLMSGPVGSNDPARTCGAELFDSVTPTTQENAELADLVAISKAQEARSIGVVPSGTVAAAAGTKLYLRLTYAVND
ncbi:hypothetical protein PAF17_16025 [Paracoccus sp. Z330]|uniref:Uncharacterized protein n=1 Tax=Paracoccus onchidii TaxID=3017813 RepID=A0ABT4ZI32_9RHOB|nr:hypothetical protein [Paracoccus onchidii]MDB6179000.1 hypothetical protein [Paracoccus onchidii]